MAHTPFSVDKFEVIISKISAIPFIACSFIQPPKATYDKSSYPEIDCIYNHAYSCSHVRFKKQVHSSTGEK